MCCKEKDKQMLVNKVNRLFAIIWQAESSIHRKKKKRWIQFIYLTALNVVYLQRKIVYNNILIDDCNIYWAIKKLQRFEINLWDQKHQQNIDVFNLEIEDQVFLFNLVFQDQRVTLRYTTQAIYEPLFNSISHFHTIKICLYNYIELWPID